jgi:TPR repeat protein
MGIMKKSIIVSILALLLSLDLFPSLSIGGEQNKEPDDFALKIMTVEVMIDQLEKMPRVTEDERNTWARLFMDIEDDWFRKIITYETSNNLNMWKLVGRWATAEGVSGKSPYANTPFFHIQRLRPNYQKDKELLRLMAKLNAIRNKEHQDLEIDGYRNFVYLFEECDTNDAKIQLLIGQEYDKGNGLWCNHSEALKWYKRAAASGNADALGKLGRNYLHGMGGLEMNEEIGVKLLNEAVTKGSADAAYTLGCYYQPNRYFTKRWKRMSDSKKAIELFQIAAERGSDNAFFSLATEYVEIGNGTEALKWANGGNEPNAVNNKLEHQRWEWNRSRADFHGRCSYIKGKVYALGIGEIEQDLNRAKELFEESYRKGSFKASVALAAMYREGIGIEANATLAEHWKSNAIKLYGFPDSEESIESRICAFARKLREASTR